MPLASGGMARIYLARATGIGSFERHVVLKMILPERTNDATSVRMFLDEARLSASLHHQNVAQVFEVGEDAGIHYLAMEYVHGQDLRALIVKAGAQGLRVPLELALTTVAGAAAGLDHAHNRRGPDGAPLGIVHRDVSPSNVMIGYDGSVKVLDFGIAKATARGIETQSGVIKGKFAYMAPEQCRGRPVDRRSDVFSLGIILYEASTQHRCFRADSDFDTMHRIVTGDVVPPSQLVRDYPPDLEKVVMTALQVDPTKRYQSAAALLEAIERVAVALRVSLSQTALGRFMRDLFGDVPEPWLVGGRPTAQLATPTVAETTISNTDARNREADAAGPPMPPPEPTRMRAATDDGPILELLPPSAEPSVIESVQRTTVPLGAARAAVATDGAAATAAAAAEIAPTSPRPVVSRTQTAPQRPSAPSIGGATLIGTGAQSALSTAPISTATETESARAAAPIATGTQSALAAAPIAAGTQPIATGTQSALSATSSSNVPRARRRWLFIAGTLFAVGAAAAIAAIAASSSSTPPTTVAGATPVQAPVTMPSTPVTMSVTPTPTPTPNPSPTPSPTPTPNPSLNPSPSPNPTPNPSPSPNQSLNPSPSPHPTPSPTPSPPQIALHIRSSPSGATVSLAGATLGKTPLDSHTAHDKDKASLVLHLDGYRDATLSVSLGSDVTQTVSLVPTRSQPPRHDTATATSNKKPDCQKPGPNVDPFSSIPICAH